MFSILRGTFSQIFDHYDTFLLSSQYGNMTVMGAFIGCRLQIMSLTRQRPPSWTRLNQNPQRRTQSSASLQYPEPITSHHNDLASFLDYAGRTGLDPESKTYMGTHYEYTVAQTLARYGFSLQRIGGRSDYGIDLLGTWSVTSAKEPLHVLIQCKALARKAGPHLVRELEGAFVGAPTGWRGSGVLGLLVALNPATKGVRESLGRSRWPMGYMALSKEGQLQQLLWNNRAEEEGLEGLGIGVRHTGESDEQQIVLTWKGRQSRLLGSSVKSELVTDIDNTLRSQVEIG